MNEYTYEQITIGQEESFSVTLNADHVRMFKEITGDLNPLHIDAEYAAAQGFPDKVVYGMLTASFLSTLAGMYLPGKHSLIHAVELKFPNPCFVTGEPLTVSGTVVEKHDAFRCITVKVSIVSSDGTKLLRGKMRIGVMQ